MGRARRAEMLEVEREHGQAAALSNGHDDGVDVADVEIGECGVELDGTLSEAWGDRHDGVLAGRDRRQKQTGGMAADA